MEMIEIVCVGLVVGGAYLHGHHVGRNTGRSETVDYLCLLYTSDAADE